MTHILEKWIETQDGSFTLIHPEHGQSYHSLAGAWSECDFVFLQPVLQHAKNKNWQTFKVLDIGFGLGLNWLCFVNYSLRNQIFLEIDSFENDEKLLSLPFKKIECADICDDAFSFWHEIKMKKNVESEFLKAKIHVADAKATLKKMIEENSPAKNIILQDPFSPKINPEVWDAEYFSLLTTLCEDDAIFVTYSAASVVQKNLKACGFAIEKQPGFAGKRERLVAYLR